MVVVEQKGNFNKTRKFLKTAASNRTEKILSKYGEEGVAALSAATPKDTGKTADSWIYTITKENGRYTITWTNTNKNNGISIALLIQYGHATKNGGYVKGVDFINSAIKPVFEKMAKEAWNEVVNL